jgi:DNA-binding response OmpR family regulator
MKRHVLVASAFNAITERIANYFSHRGYRVSTVQGGVDCVTQIERTPPDVVILDWNLPWGGGAGVLARLHDSDATNRIPVVLLHEEFSNEPIVNSPSVRSLQIPCDVQSVYLAADSVLTSANNRSNPMTTSDEQHQMQTAPG